MKLKQLLTNSPASPEAGYTIIESLVAMVMVAALMVAVAPVIVLSVGTRVNARRVELAAQAGRSYIDWVRSDSTDNSPAILINDAFSTIAYGTLDCPTSGDYCDGPTTGSVGGQFYCVNNDDTDGCQSESLTDMVVHAGTFGESSNTDYIQKYASDRAKAGYRLYVRVYRADAFLETGDLTVDTPATYITNAIGDRKAPLVSTSTDIAPTEKSFNNLQNRFDN